eukprot:scpid87990/ scgid22476/ Glutaredoxin-related protein 5, mitochondrial; Monothiol glutaredoxin-5
MAFLQRFSVPRVALLTRSFCAAANYTETHFDNLVKNNKVVVFMKGVPDEPRCGFSNAVVRILSMHGVEDFDSHNVLEDDKLREGMKEYTAWPTFPQVYFNGEFLGGCDILLEMHQKGDLVQELQKVGIRSALLDEESKSSTT